MPVVRVPDECTYYKEDAGKLLVGAFEPKAKPWGGDGIDEDHAFETLPEDMDHFEPILTACHQPSAAARKGGHRAVLQRPGKLYAGRPLLSRRSAGGAAISIVATGFNSIGIQSSGGAGLVLSQWIKNGHPPMDVNGMDIRRIHPFQSVKRYVRDRAVRKPRPPLCHALALSPGGDGARRPALADPRQARRSSAPASARSMAGSGRTGIAPHGVEPEYEYSYGRQNWFPYAEAEAKALQAACAFFDQSSFAKYPVEGKDALQGAEQGFRQRRSMSSRAASSTRNGATSGAASRPI